MKRRILFSPIGTTDPMMNFRDGSMLHICRVYQPDEVYLYLSAEVMKWHEMDNRYEYSIQKLAEKQGREIKVNYIMRPDLHNVQIYDVFYEDFRHIIGEIRNNIDAEDELLVNIASGTPAMKSVLLTLAVLAEYRFLPIQVSTPLRKSNRRDERIEDFDVSTYWELNEDNEPDFENRCVEVKSKNYSALIKLENIRKFVKSYDYHAGLVLAKEIKPLISERAYCLLEAANARLMLDFRQFDKLMQGQNEDFIPIKSGNQRAVFEYALSLEIKLFKKEYADFLRALTPLTYELAETILRVQCKIKLENYCTIDKRGVKRFDMDKLEQNPEMLKVLNEEFEKSGGLKKDTFVGTRQIAPLIRHYSHDESLKQQMDAVVKVEQKVRNMAAHDIVSVTDDWIHQETGFSAQQIFSIIKKLIVKAGIKTKESDWKSYDAMNQILLDELNI